MPAVTIFHGRVVDVGQEAGTLTILENAWVVVDNSSGIILEVTTGKPTVYPNVLCTHEMPLEHVLCPGFIDTHVHAAQVQYQGTGTDLPLMKWLEKYAFPSEKKLTNSVELSRTVYSQLVSSLIANGTTTCLYFGVMGLASSQILVDVVRGQGQRAMIGKVNMNRLAPKDYCETTEESLLATKQFIEYVRRIPGSLVHPVITPRFVPSCTEELLIGLGELAASENCRIQSHAVESVDCLRTVEKLHPGQDEVEILGNAGLLTDKSIMAHCVHLSDAHVNTFVEQGVSIAHCPLSNVYFAGGALRTKSLMDKGINIGLGTDIAGGYSHRMLNSVRHCMTTHLMVCSADASAGASADLHLHDVPHVNVPDASADVNAEANSRCKHVAPGAGNAVKRDSFNFKHAIWLATMGGARVLGLENTVGRIAEGLEFDALLLDLTTFQDVLGNDPMVAFEKFVHLGDDRHILNVWIQGQPVK